MSAVADRDLRARAQLDAGRDEPTPRAWHTRYFGKQGEVLQALKKIGEVPKEERPAYGVEANRIKETLTRAYEQALSSEKDRAVNQSLQANALDVTMPGRPIRRGRLHV